MGSLTEGRRKLRWWKVTGAFVCVCVCVRVCVVHIVSKHNLKVNDGDTDSVLKDVFLWNCQREKEG